MRKTPVFLVEETGKSLPECALVAAVLSRAVRDLVSDAEKFRLAKEAITWFLTTDKPLTGYEVPRYTYQDCVRILSLSANQQRILKLAVLEVKREIYGELEAEGCACGERDSSLVSDLIARMRSTKNAAILRKQRNLRHSRYRVTV